MFQLPSWVYRSASIAFWLLIFILEHERVLDGFSTTLANCYTTRFERCLTGGDCSLSTVVFTQTQSWACRSEPYLPGTRRRGTQKGRVPPLVPTPGDTVPLTQASAARFPVFSICTSYCSTDVVFSQQLCTLLFHLLDEMSVSGHQDGCFCRTPTLPQLPMVTFTRNQLYW